MEKKYIDIDAIDPLIDILQELDTKERKIWSLRGFFLYASETRENGKSVEVLKTNLKSSFWRTLKPILRQNKKTVLIKFLFPNFLAPELRDNEVSKNFEDQIKNIKNFKSLLKSIQNEFYSLKERVIHLENQILIKEEDTNVLSDASRIDQKVLSNTEHGDSSLKHNFITLSQISEPEKIEIIERGFQLNQDGKISLKKYYESTEESSLFEFKGYSIKYDTIRRTKLYQQLKP